MKVDKKETTEARSAFDVTGPSQFGASLQKGHKATQSAINGGASKIYGDWWSIGKPTKKDQDRKFLAINRSQFGTRKLRQKT